MITSEEQIIEKKEKEIFESYINGTSTYGLADKFDCYGSLILDILNRHKVIKRPSKQ